MSKTILNEGYIGNTDLFYYGNQEKIFTKNKSYLDLSMCAGSILLGHNHAVFKKVIKSYLKKNISNFAAPNIYADKFSKSIRQLIPNSNKIIFCNSGTEAVIKTLRIARSLNNRSKIGLVTGGWHGSVDQLLYKANKNLKVVELSSGLPQEFKKNIILLPYNDQDETKKILKQNKNRISCIITEPVQAALPHEEIKEYLKFLENYSKKNKIILIFDEMITGIRTNCSSLQKYFNVKADISTFGKCFGAGLPIGIISVSKSISDKLEKLKTKVFFGGTFSGNSMATYVGYNVLNYIKENKSKIFNEINKNAKFFEKTLNDFFKKEKLDLKIYRFQSMLRLVYTKQKLKDRQVRDFLEIKKTNSMYKFKRYIKSQKIHLPSNGIIFFSYCHKKNHIKYVIDKFKTGSIKFFNHKNICQEDSSV